MSSVREGDRVLPAGTPRQGEDQADAIARLGPWFHNLHMPDGTQTAPDHNLGDFPSYKWQRLAPHLPEDLHGWSVLDIGCNAGFYTFELARRGAHVTALDSDRHYLDQARWASGVYGLSDSIEFRQIQVYDLAHEADSYDLVLFMGVFYHLRYPMLGLDTVAQRVGRLMVFQTMTMPGDEILENTQRLDLDYREPMLDPGWPKMAFIEGRLADDPTNWWAPNIACVEAMLRSAGMRITKRLPHELYLCEPNLEKPSVMTTWNAGEYRAATGQAATGQTPTGQSALQERSGRESSR